jgi:multicomponent Na+:H+ antiporter subunit E
MKLFLLNLLLALVWRGMIGRAGLEHIILGFIIGYFVLWWLRPLLGETRYFSKLPAAIRFAAFFVWELIMSNLRVAYDVVTPRAYRRPAVVAVPLEARTDAEITLLASLLTLTPSTLTLDVSDDRQVMYVHAMFVDDPEALRREIKEGFERRVLELLR